MLQTHNKKSKVFLGNIKVKKAYIGSRRVYSAGNIATYYVDTGKVYSEEVDSDASCLSPTTFTPTKSGWTFVGWREDKTANSSVLSKKIMDDELKTLREKDKLTQYDVDRAELRYQIALKQIALEEAQQNKSKMRLRRDSQGNYTYQYTADENAVASLENELSDLYNQLYNLDANTYKNNLNELYSV